MPEVVVRYTERTCLQEEALIRLIKRYSRDLTHNILIVFDKRITSMGIHFFDGQKRIHTVRISPRQNKYQIRGEFDVEEKIKIGPIAEKYNLIGTILHELKHAKQREEMGQKYYNQSFATIDKIPNPEIAEYFSKCETEARVYENIHLHTAVACYDADCEPEKK